MYTMNEEDAEIRCMERRTVLAGVYLENVPNHSKDDKKFCRCQVGGQNHASRQLGAAAHAARQLGAAAHALTLRIR